MATPRKHPYQKEIDDCFTIIGNDQSECDKQLLTLSSGFLAVSLAFIKDIVKLTDASWLWSLYTSWTLLAFCIFFVLFSFQYSIAGNFKAKKYWEDLRDNPNLEYPFGHATRIKWINRICAGLFGLGVCFLVVFIICNVHKESSVTITHDGALMKTPPQQGDWVQKGANLKVPPPSPPSKPVPSNPSSSSTSTGQGSSKK